jgi:hypothetical protein
MNWLVIPIAFAAMFIHAMAGFGSALIAMPFLLLVFSDSPDNARAIFAIAAQASYFYFLFQYRKEWNWRNLVPLLLGSLIGIPLGFYVAVLLNEETFMLVLGIITIAYALYTLSGLTMPEMKERWGLVFGMFSGLLQGAYNVGGPPLVMYGLSQNWQPALFKFNATAMFFLMGLFIIGGHYQQGNLTQDVLINGLVMIPAMFLALFAGFSLDRFVRPKAFRIGVSILLIILGLTMIF